MLFVLARVLNRVLALCLLVAVYKCRIIHSFDAVTRVRWDPAWYWLVSVMCGSVQVAIDATATLPLLSELNFTVQYSSHTSELSNDTVYTVGLCGVLSSTCFLADILHITANLK